MCEGTARWCGDLILESERLKLTHLKLEDARDIEQYAGDRTIADNTRRIPHPYPPGAAEKFIRQIHEECAAGREMVLAVHSKELGSFVGCIGIMRDDPDTEVCELGFWIGKPFWGRGYCTEAGHRLLRYLFMEQNLDDKFGMKCVSAKHFSTNTQSGKVIKKLGMKYEGRLRQRIKKLGQYMDLDSYSILREEYT